jgi:hypothetical protein
VREDMEQCCKQQRKQERWHHAYECANAHAEREALAVPIVGATCGRRARKH